MYVYTTIVSIGQFLSLLITGVVSYAGTSIFDRLSIPTLQISQLVPGLVYFVMLKVAQQVLLILLGLMLLPVSLNLWEMRRTEGMLLIVIYACYLVGSTMLGRRW